MLDNLRRTLSAPAAFLTLIAGWTLPFASPVIWTTFVLATIAFPALLPVLTGLIPRRRGISKRSHVRAVGTDLVLPRRTLALAVTLLAHQAWLMTDAIVRTLFRVYVTRRNLLEWVTAAQAKSGSDLTLGSVYRRMGGAVALAAARRHPRRVRAAGSMAGCGAVRSCSGRCHPWWHTGSACHRARPGLSPFRQMTLARSG